MESPMNIGSERRMSLVRGAVSIIVDAIDNSWKINRIILHGSVARGGANEGSDTDLLIVFEDKVSFDQFHTMVFPLIANAMRSAKFDQGDLHIEQCSAKIFYNPPASAEIMRNIKNEPYITLYDGRLKQEQGEL
jgi:predicted nucleotidyltransferase